MEAIDRNNDLVDGYCARWSGDEGGATSTLYLCRLKGLVVSFH